MEKIKVREVIIVEGKYDLNTIKQLVDGIVLTTDGFGIFHNSEKLSLIRRMAKSRGVILLTDSDGAGFVIRSYLKGALPKEQVKQAYIPDIAGKERRKRTASKEGKLGVEGMRPEVLREALLKAGATIDGKAFGANHEITKADLYAMGLSGGPNSAKNRQRLLMALDLPERLSANAMLDVLNVLMTREQLLALWTEISE